MVRKFSLLAMIVCMISSCCLPCPSLEPRFTKPCERLIYEATLQGIIVIQRGDTLRMILPADAFFYPASSKIKEESKPALATAAALTVCYCYGYMPVSVIGYTDNMGSIKQQKQLGWQRAKNIAAFLWGQGVPWDRIRLQSRGARGTVSSNGTPAGEADNRRVEITVP